MALIRPHIDGGAAEGRGRGGALKRPAGHGAARPQGAARRVRRARSELFGWECLGRLGSWVAGWMGSWVAGWLR